MNDYKKEGFDKQNKVFLHRTKNFSRLIKKLREVIGIVNCNDFSQNSFFGIFNVPSGNKD